MPTPKAAAIFERLVAARNRLNEITKQLNSLEPQLGSENRRLLESQWDNAFRSFEAVTQEFYESVRQARDELGIEPEN